MAFSFCFDGDIFSIPIYGIISDQTGNSVQSVQRRHPMSSEHHQQDRLMDIIKRGGLFHSCRKKMVTKQQKHILRQGKHNSCD